jgi:hypothetical protein
MEQCDMPWNKNDIHLPIAIEAKGSGPKRNW